MKRLLAFILAVIMCLSLAACGDGGNSGGGSSKSKSKNKISKVDISSISLDLGEDAPSQKIVKDDIKKAVEEKNRNVSITDLDVEKSITDEKDCEITLNVDGKSKYADWKYQIIMQYTEYDQGWMLDDMEWVQEVYDVTRLPEEKDFVNYVNNEYSGDRIRDHLPVKDGKLNEREFTESGTIELSWSYRTEHKYAYRDIDCTTYWMYSADEDNWEYDTSSIKYYTTPKDIDLTGRWDGTGLAASSITISDFSWNGFNMNMNGNEFYCSPGSTEDSVGDGTLWFNGGGMQIGINLGDNIRINCVRRNANTYYQEFYATRE